MERPRFFSAAATDPAEREALATLRAGGVTEVDTLDEQIDDWVLAEDPRRKKDPEGRARAAKELAPDRSTFGGWVYFPWSRTLVRVLPPPLFRRLRLDRNRNKISAEEQERLARAKIAVAGLSVGLAVVTTLAQEGVGGHFVLADFDTLAVSNLNRLQAPLAWLGLPKTTIAARKIWEIDPFAEVTLLPEGVTDGNLDRFLEGVDLLVEECDSLGLKLRLREAAKARRIPVVMETSDAGMLDVERFDREPARPILHGRTAGIDSTTLDRLTAKEKVPLFLRIVPPERMTARMGASLVDIDRTVASWPQLASAVALGGAVVTDTVRRILLGTFTASGRFYVDLPALVHPDRDVLATNAAAAPATPAPRACVDLDATPLRPAVGLEGLPLLRALAEAAHRAPSAGNAQPWSFSASDDARALYIHHDERRDARMAAYHRRPSLVALGAAAEYACVAAAAAGHTTELSYPDEGPAVVVRLTGPCPPREGAAAALAALGARMTDRRRGARRPISAADREALLASAPPGLLRLVDAPEELARLGALLGTVDRARWVERTLHEEIVRELRTREEAWATGDGIEVASLALHPADEAALPLLCDRRHVDEIAAVSGGEGLAAGSEDDLAGSDAFAILFAAGDRHDRRAWLRAGASVTGVWAAACARGFAFHPHAAPYLLARLAEEGTAAAAPGAPPLEAPAHAWLTEVLGPLTPYFGAPEGAFPALAFRLARPGPGAVLRALRRPLEDVLQGALATVTSAGSGATR